MKPNHTIEVELFVILCRYPDLRGEGDWERFTNKGEVFDSFADAEMALDRHAKDLWRSSGFSSGTDYTKWGQAYGDETTTTVMLAGYEYVIVPLSTSEEERRLGADFAAEHPEWAAKNILTVHEAGGDVKNAWDVLVSGVGRTEAWSLFYDAVRLAGIADSNTQGDVTRKAHEILGNIT